MAGEMETAAGVMLLPLKQLSLHVTFTQSEKEKRKKKSQEKTHKKNPPHGKRKRGKYMHEREKMLSMGFFSLP